METTETAALAVREDAYTGKALLTKEVLRQEAQQRALVAQYVREQMREGTDFGTIPGTPKPTLLKPGAEKLVDLFRCTPDFKVVEKTQEWERGFFNYIFRCSIKQRDSGAVLAVGFGSANSFESRYRWREGKRKCPNCNSEALLLSKQKPEWFCWAKKGGCGAVFPKADKRVMEQVVGRVENPDLPDMANTVLKMAKKRALVDASIALARCSDMFTQDVEDFAHEAPVEEAAPPSPAPRVPTMREAERRTEEAHKRATADVDRTPPGYVSTEQLAPAEGTLRVPSQAVAREAQHEAVQRVQRHLGGEVQRERQPGEDDGPQLDFGPWKSKPRPIDSTLTASELSAAIDFAGEKLKAFPKASWAHGMKTRLEALEAEVGRREKPAQSEADVPF